MKDKSTLKLAKKRTLELLRSKQKKEGIKYQTTADIPFKLLMVFAYISMIVTSAINLFTLLGQYGWLNAYIATEEHVILQLNEIRVSLTYLAILSLIFFFGFILSIAKKYLLHLLITLLSGVGLLFSHYYALESSISANGYTSFLLKAVTPIGLTLIFVIAADLIAIKQTRLDKMGTDEISAYIYKEFSVMAEDLNEEDWNKVVLGFEPAPKSKKKSVKKRLEKEKKAENNTAEKDIEV